ncbi:hypothetical protein D3C80_528260 [compost metagenome]
MAFDESHRPKFWRTGHCHGPRVGEEPVERIHVRPKAALDMVNRVDEARIHLDLPASDHLHRTRLADAALVVSVDIGAHRQLRLVLLRIQQLEDLLAIGNRILAALDRARDRAGLDTAARNADEHFRRCADQIFLVAEIDEEGIGRWVDSLQPVGNLGRLAVATFHEFLAGNHFEQIAATETLLRLGDELGIFARLVIALRRRHRRAHERIGRDVLALALGRHATLGEIVAVDPGLGCMVVDDEDFVGKKQYHVALVFRPLHGKLDRVELEGKVVTESAEQADRRIGFGIEEVNDRAQNGKHRRHLRALFLGKHAGRLVDRKVEAAGCPLAKCQILYALQPLSNEAEQHFAARVIRLDPDLATIAGDPERRVDDCRIPSRITTRIFVIRRKDGAAALVQPVDIRRDCRCIFRRTASPAYGYAASRLVGLGTVLANDRHHCNALASSIWFARFPQSGQ